MPRIEDLISEKSKKNLNKAKSNMNIKAQYVEEKFIGQTPNLNSSLGINAADGTITTATTTTTGTATTSKLQNVLGGVGTLINNSGILGQLLGGGSGQSSGSSGGGYYPPAPQQSNTGKYILYGVIALVLIIIIVLIIKKAKKK